ncbi:MAG: hypothetical protein L0K02_10350, partial [Corynebacterium sp.]|nr:hypothetical protein [Corynebacterium sp.]
CVRRNATMLAARRNVPVGSDHTPGPREILGTQTTPENIRSSAVMVPSPGSSHRYDIVVVWLTEIDHITK